LRAALALLLPLLLALGVAGCGGGFSHAPQRLSTQVTDEVDALAGRGGEVQQALSRLQSQTGIQLFVVYVETFGDYDPNEWFDETARLSGLGDRDGLLAVATEDRVYLIDVQATALTQEQLDEVAAVAIEPALAVNDWAGAAVGAAEGVRAALAKQVVQQPPLQPGDPHPGGTGESSWLGALVCLLMVAGVLAALVTAFVLSRRRQRQARLAADPNDANPGVSTQQLSDRANTLLLQVDDALRTSESELSLATADYGDEETKPFADAITAAKADITEAFRLRMELEELPGEDETGRRQRLAEIIRLGEAADRRLDEQAQPFHELRALESTLEQTVPALTQRRAGIAAAVPRAESTLVTLRERYSGSTVATVAGNVDQAQQRLRFATASLAKAGEQAAVGKRGPAALAVRAAGQALDQADELLAAIDRANADLAAAAQALPALLAEVTAEVEQARAALAVGGPAQPGTTAPGVPAGPALVALATALAAGEAAVAAVRSAQQASTMDPVAELRRLQDADAVLDHALEAHRDQQERVARAAAMIDAALAAARAEVAAAANFINTRRGAVGTQARTLLAEAQRLLALAEAHAATDPVTALDEAQRADRTAEQATQAAESDVDSWSHYGPGGSAGGRGGGLDGLTGAILGGILVGGSRGGYWGGGWGPGFGGPRRGGASGGPRGGGFGGVRTGGSFGGRSPGGFGGRRTGGRF